MQKPSCTTYLFLQNIMSYKCLRWVEFICKAIGLVCSPVQKVSISVSEWHKIEWNHKIFYGFFVNSVVEKLLIDAYAELFTKMFHFLFDIWNFIFDLNY